MLLFGEHIFPLIVAPFKTWFQLCLNILYHSFFFGHIGYQHTKDVCPFIAYYVTESETVFGCLVFW